MRNRLWSSPDVRTFMAGRVVSELGSRVTREGLPIVAILAVGATAPEVGLLAALASLAGIGVAPWAGVVVDRARRRPVMIGADLFRALVLLTIPAAALLHRLTFWQIATVTALVGGATVLFDVADQAWLPQFVSRRSLSEGNALVAGASAVGETGGPALMGGLIQWVGGPMAILFDAVSYLVSAASLLLIRQPEPRPEPGGGDATATQQALAGLRVVLSHPILRPLALTAGTQSLFGGFFRALYEIIALRTLHLTPLAVGLLISAGGAGALAGSAVASAAARRFGIGRALWVASLGSGVLAFLVPLAPSPLPVAFGALFLAQLLGDATGTVFDVNEAVVRQAITPDGWLGRVTGSGRWLAAVLAALGALVAGVLAGTVGMRAALFVAAAGQTLAPAWLVFSRCGAVREPGLAQPTDFMNAFPAVGTMGN